ncbi:MAG: efflux RND transporter periplasmic adaptor subunit [Chloroflexi bacterium]|nr:efflux RND transporter periplasmic adaptor subunit [Chloroflexota bacterium]
MKLRWSILILITTLILGACMPQATPTPSTTEAEPTPVIDAGVNASAVVVPLDVVELAYTTVGRVKSVEVKVGDEVTAGQALVQLDTAILDAQVIEAEFNVQALQSQLDKLTRNIATERDRDIARANLEAGKAKLDSIKAQLANTTLITPISGTVTAVDISVGETATPGRILITVADISAFRVETTDLSEVDVPQVKIGQTATVYIEALDREITGKVIEIDQQSQTIGGDVVFKVTIELDEQPEGLRWGMSAEVTLEE